AVQVQDVDLALVHDPKQGGECERIELRSIQIRDVDTERVERFLGEVLLTEADERNPEAIAIEARNHPAEEPFDSVHPRPLPPEVVAHLQDVQRTADHILEAVVKTKTDLDATGADAAHAVQIHRCHDVVDHERGTDLRREKVCPVET